MVVTISYQIKNEKNEEVRHEITFYVADIHEDAILGMNWLKKFNPTVSWTKEKIRFGPRQVTGKIV
jgi:hypothetical protein